MRRPIAPALALLAMAAMVTACRHDGRDMREPTFGLPPTTTTSLPPSATVPLAVPATVPPLDLLAPWADGATVPTRNTCDDIDVSPALTWTNVPAGTVEVALTVTDLDADNWVHWIVLGLDPGLSGLVEGQVPAGAVQWENTFGDAAWGGPCPPPGEPAHTYLFTVHALNQPLAPADDASAAEVVGLLNELATAQSSVSGTYARTG